MAEHAYASGIAGHIVHFVEQKQATGHPYKSSLGTLQSFDAMMAEFFPSDEEVTKESCDYWISLNSSRPKSLGHKITAIRQLAKYMAGIGIPAFIIPSHIPSGREKYEPHIYTSQEKTAFFRSIDQCQWRRVSPMRCYVAPMIFRFLYCCGLRTSEAVNLKVEDIDLVTGKVVIRGSKGWRARVIYTSRDLLENLRVYNALIERILPGRVPFFPNRHGDFYAKGVLARWFHEFWDILPEAELVAGNRPRVHDWRHTHLTDRLNLWIEEGSDVNALYIYLSEYAGHANFSSTAYYLHLVSGFYPEMEKRLLAINEYVLPEVDYEEE